MHKTLNGKEILYLPRWYLVERQDQIRNGLKLQFSLFVREDVQLSVARLYLFDEGSGVIVTQCAGGSTELMRLNNPGHDPQEESPALLKHASSDAMFSTSSTR